MNNCDKIKAHMFMEEKYERMSLSYGNDEQIKVQILESIEKVKNETSLNPTIIERMCDKYPDRHTISVECEYDDNRICGEFFTKLLQELEIDKCESDV